RHGEAVGGCRVAAGVAGVDRARLRRRPRRGAQVRLLHHYHIWTGGTTWQHILDEHLDTLARAEFDGEFTINLLGPDEAKAEARAMIAASVFEPTIFDFGNDFENDSINYVRERAVEDPELAIMYAHSKGAWHVDQINEIWRERMERALIKEWRYA